ncbi:Delta-60 repeat-containing protein [Fluviicola taffensis DSM 16823]|uniref:Delta-60 repeat-containing protein n=2 Tax=Fluviicola TaxID=332102 RepID=F2I937_FLUTR|nr:Delta-60 repeat-containing protein [Fluviicola taffensis DSM 16823]
MKQLIVMAMMLFSAVLSFGQNGWNDNEFVIGSGFNGSVYTSLALPDNGVVFGGDFTSYNGTNCQGIVKLRPDGTIDPNWLLSGYVPGAQNFSGGATVMDLKLESTGTILVSGAFPSYYGVGCPNLARINSLNGQIDIAFRDALVLNPPNGAVWSVDTQSDGKIILGGDFSTLAAANVRNGVARLLTNGSVDNTFTFSGATNATVRKVKVQSDNKILVGGNFTTINGVAKNRITRLNADGTSDATFLGNGANNFVLDIEVQSDNKILLCGDFTSYDVLLANRFIRLNPNGVQEGTFNNFNSTVRTMSILSNGSIAIGGQFDLFPTYPGIRFAVLNADLTYNSTFANPSANNTVLTTCLLADGRIAAGGGFTFFRGQAREKAAVMQYCDGFSIGTASSSPTLCINTALTPITHAITGGTSFTKVISSTGLPGGVTAAVVGGQLSISGTPTTSGTFNYSVTLSACQAAVATGIIIVNQNVLVSSAAASVASCIDVPLTPFTRTTFNASAIGSPTGLPPGISVAFSSNVITFSGTPTTAGVFNYSIPVTGNCASEIMTGTITVRPDVVVTDPATNYQCALSSFIPIGITVANATSIGTPTGFTGGMSATLSGNSVTINGTNTSFPGVYNYTIPVNGLCKPDTIFGTLITVDASELIPSNTMTNPPAVCVGLPIDTIKIATNQLVSSISESATFPLPAGINFSYVNDTIYIFGTATAPGATLIIMEASSPCGTDQISGMIEINSDFIFAGPAPTFTPVCVNTPITTVTQPFGGGNIDSIINLPQGITAVVLPFNPPLSNGGIEFSGTPTQSGTFNYTIYTSNPCTTEVLTGTMIINAASVSVSAASATPTVCTGSTITPITHTITGTGSVGAATGLPAGITASNAGNTITISGSSTISGTYNYTIPISGSCGSVNATGTITIITQNTVSAEPAAVVNCVNNAMTPIVRTTGGATGIGAVTGLPAGVSASWNANTLTINGTPTSIGTFNYSIPLTGGCGTVNATGTFVISPETACTQGIEENNSIQLTVFPNPVNDKVNITFEGTSTVSIDFIDINGKLVATNTGIQSGDVISIEHLEKGVYLMLVKSSEGNIIERLIKQ